MSSTPGARGAHKVITHFCGHYYKIIMLYCIISAVLRAVSEGQYSKPKGLKTKLLIFKQTIFGKKKRAADKGQKIL